MPVGKIRFAWDLPRRLPSWSRLRRFTRTSTIFRYNHLVECIEVGQAVVVGFWHSGFVTVSAITVRFVNGLVIELVRIIEVLELYLKRFLIGLLLLETRYVVLDTVLRGI